MRSWIRWVALVAVASLLGSVYVQYLVTHPLRMGAYLSFCFLLIFVLLLILTRYFAGGQRLGAIALSLVAYAAGWYIMTGVVLDREDSRPMPWRVPLRCGPS